MEAALEHLPPRPRRVASYAVGLSEADGTARQAHGGKGLRPAIAVLCAQAAGGAAQAAVAGAVAIELVHTFTLVHDDIMDRDERRRHRPTVWKAYGVGPAILSGDALLVLAIRTLTAADAASAPTAVRYLSDALLDLVHGQADDIAFERRPYTGPGAVTVEEYTGMTARKTGALLGCAAAVGTLLGGGSPRLAADMTRMGASLGVAFQTVDDLLGISGDPEITGKPILSDLRRRKKTLPILHALQSGTPPGRRLAELLETHPDDTESLRRAAELIDAAGGRASAQRQAEHHLTKALAIIEQSDLKKRPADHLTTLSTHLIHRTH